VSILDGPCTYMWTYNGTYPGLTIRRPSGQPTQVTFTHNLPALAGNMTVHHHGNHSRSEHDGQAAGAQYLFGPGTSRTYVYEGVENGEPERGALQWYHDHRMGESGLNVWMGLTGLYILDDENDPAGLPSGVYELPLVIADRQFDEQNQLMYIYDPDGVVGDKVLINGAYQPYVDVADRKYRLRILNGANARIYTLILSNGDPFIQIGTESGLLPAPVTRTAMEMGPGERVDVIVDFAGRMGQELYLVDAAKGKGAPLMKFRVTHHVPDNSTIPAQLRPLPELGEPTVTRHFAFDFTKNHWTINGHQFDEHRVDARPVLGATEKWVFTNPTGQAHMVHIHDVDQQCISRNGGPCHPYEAQKETWNVGPGETLELKMKFTDHLGIYMLHCHILEHEDDGMMTLFEVVAPVTATNVVSRKLHGDAGTFDVNLPLTGTPGVESRNGGPNGEYQLVFAFGSPVTFDSATISSGAGSVSSTNGSGSTTVTVNLTGVTNAQTTTVTLQGASNGTATNNIAVQMAVLVGDVNGDRTVNSGDVIQTRGRSGQAADATTFRSDVNADGTVNSGDSTLVRARSGTALP
jgi:spore coat protein A, manganese oxidase